MDSVSEIIKRAFEEDIGTGDITTESTVPDSLILTGRFSAKSTGVIAGLELCRHVFGYLDPRVETHFRFRDGDRVSTGAVIGTITGPGRSILSGERVALNFMQRMSGIASLTREFVEAVSGTGVVILDTRKTVPGLRVLDKWAVRLGGGENHRTGLYDMALIKENHITAAGGIGPAVAGIRAHYGNTYRIEVEVKDLKELQEALNSPVDMIMLDNFSTEDMKKAVSMTAGKILLEASGNVSARTVGDIAATGVNYISIGMLTHSVQAMDISLIINENSGDNT